MDSLTDVNFNLSISRMNHFLSQFRTPTTRTPTIPTVPTYSHRCSEQSHIDILPPPRIKSLLVSL